MNSKFLSLVVLSISATLATGCAPAEKPKAKKASDASASSESTQSSDTEDPAQKAPATGNLKTTQTCTDIAPKVDSELLLKSASVGNATCVKAAIDAKVDVDSVDAKDEAKNTALHLAAVGGHADVIELLIAAQAKVDAKNASGDLAIHLAVGESYVAAAKALTAKHAQTLNAANNSGETPVLKFAAKMVSDAAKGQDASEMLAYLVQAKADFSLKDARENNVYHLASGVKSQATEALMAALIAACKGQPVDINAQNANKKSPLDIQNAAIAQLAEGPAKAERLKIAKAMVDAGAKVSTPTVTTTPEEKPAEKPADSKPADTKPADAKPASAPSGT